MSESPRQRILAAATRIREDGHIPDETAALLARLIEKRSRLRLPEGATLPEIPLQSTDLRTTGHVPDEAADPLATAMEQHMELTIGPDSTGQWPDGWLGVDMAQLDLANAILDRDRQPA